MAQVKTEYLFIKVSVMKSGYVKMTDIYIKIHKCTCT